MTLGLLDLSIVTDQLIDQLKTYRNASRLWEENKVAPTPLSINVTGLAPGVAHSAGGCQLSVYLFHVAVDKFHRNTFPSREPPRPPAKGIPEQRIPEQPLALSLYFLVTALSDKADTAYIEEQQAMSIALKFFHEHPRITATVPLGSRESELTMTFEPQTVDETGRLWQAFAAPMRLSAVYRAAVVFLEPPAPKQPLPVESYALDVVPGLIVATVTAGADGLARIAIADAGFVQGATLVFIRRLAIPETTAARPAAGEFRVVDASTLELAIPAGKPPGGDLLFVRAAADKPTMVVWLLVPPPPDVP